MAVVISNLTRLSRCKSKNYTHCAQIIRNYSNAKPIRNNSFTLLGVLTGGLAAISYLKWQKIAVVEAAFNPKKMKVGWRVIKNF